MRAYFLQQVCFLAIALAEVTPDSACSASGCQADVGASEAEALRVSMLQRPGGHGARAVDQAAAKSLEQRRADLRAELLEMEGEIARLEGGGCTDSSEHCGYWADHNECENNAEWMSSHCAASCNKCGGAESCEDSDTSCGGWANQGECEKNKGWMYENCKKSCGQCEENSVPPIPQAPLKCTGWPNSNPRLSFEQRCEKGNELEDGFEYVYNRHRGKPDARCGPDAHCFCCRRKEPDPLTPEQTGGLMWHTSPNRVAVNEGQDVGQSAGKSIDKCQLECDANARCNSFTTCEGSGGRTCHFKSAKLDGTEEMAYNQYCSSHFKSADTYVPGDSTLAKPSNGQIFQFYMYRVQGEPPDYSLDSVNTGTLGGIMWYLHNECIFTCKGAGFLSDGGKWGDRKFGITRIRRFKVSVRATAPLLRKGMNFGTLKAFDSGECTGPHVGNSKWGPNTGDLSVPEWQELGYNVGCGYVGMFPHNDWTSGFKYPEAIWYSLPGACPIHNYREKDQACIQQHPGGRCDGMPTGQGNCTYHVQDAGEINIDELVGIKQGWGTRANFCSKCKIEGSNRQNGGCGLHFWDDMWDKNKNAERVQKALDMFHTQYPTMPKAHELQTPPCDVNSYTLGFHDQPNQGQGSMYRH